MRYRRKPRGMARKGSKCRKWRRVRVKGQGYAWRCAAYSRGRKRGGSRKRRRGRRPFNKGRKCVQRYKSGPRKGKCRSYGARPRVGRHKMHGPMRAEGSYYTNSPNNPAPAAPAWTDPYIW